MDRPTRRDFETAAYVLRHINEVSRAINTQTFSNYADARFSEMADRVDELAPHLSYTPVTHQPHRRRSQ